MSERVMSETAKCKCGALVVKQADGTGLHYGAWFSGGCHYSFEPAEPVIEVAPGEPTCEYCGPVCYRGAAHNARVEDGARYTDDPVPPVPAQEAPRCNLAEIPGHDCAVDACEPSEPQAGAQPKVYVVSPQGVEEYVEVAPGEFERCEPQAGAQVPSQDEIPEEVTKLKQELQRVYSVLNHWYKESRRFEDALDRISSYAREAAKTPITREDMHDHLKAQTFFDEAKGFERLVLSEIGGGK